MQNQIRDFRFPDLNKITLLHLSLRSSIQCLRQSQRKNGSAGMSCTPQTSPLYSLAFASKPNRRLLWPQMSQKKAPIQYLRDKWPISIRFYMHLYPRIDWLRMVLLEKLSRYKQTSGMRAEKFPVLSGQCLWFHWFHARNWCFAEQWCRWKFHAWCLIVFEIFWHKKKDCSMIKHLLMWLVISNWLP